MKIELKRIAAREQYTIGRLYLNGEYFCDTLEDTLRAPGVKIPGQTAIPAGTYSVVLNCSPKFNRLLPRLLDVPGFDGILMHRGNTHRDTAGCILVGKNTAVGMVTDSYRTENLLIRALQYSGQYRHTITITNP